MEVTAMKRLPEPSLKIQVRLPASLKQEIERQAEEAGQPLTTYVQRALAAHVIKAKAAAQT
jgi:predicted HicB family RNase H-like nuclease